MAHLRAVEVDEADGHRVIIVESQVMYSQIQEELAAIANRTTTGINKNISKIQIPYFIMWLAATIT